MKEEKMKGEKISSRFYLTDCNMEEIRAEAARLDRSMSWLLNHAWVMARTRFAEMPSQEEILEKAKKSKKIAP